MTPDRLREILALLAMSQRGFAFWVGHSEGSVRGWARGSRAVPDDIAAWLERLGRWLEQNPPPRSYRRAA